MAEVNNKIFERAKTALVQLTHFEHQNLLLGFKIHDDTEGRIYFPFAEKDFIGRKRIAYFFLSKLDALIHPLLADIMFVERSDIDGRFVFIKELGQAPFI